MSVHLDDRPLADATVVEQTQDYAFSDLDFELDVTIVEGGPAADQLIRLTDDGCNSTCQTACNSCP